MGGSNHNLDLYIQIHLQNFVKSQDIERLRNPVPLMHFILLTYEKITKFQNYIYEISTEHLDSRLVYKCNTESQIQTTSQLI